MIRKVTSLRGLGLRLNSDVGSTATTLDGASSPAAQAPLVDSFGRRHDYLRISLTERCNLRCRYCMPAEGVALSARAALLAREETARLARVFAALGVRKARLTGGEPTLRADLAPLLAALRAAGLRALALTTNGLTLTRQLPALQRAGLDALNVSLDSLRAARYEAMARRAGLSRVLAGIDLALQLGYAPVKINTVLMKGFNDDEICDFVEYTRDRDVEVRFIEFMPFTGNAWESNKMVPERVALRMIAQQYELEPLPPRPNDTARVWRVAGHRGTVGFISSMTKKFCSTCNRLRLTADGNLKVCLFGAAEVSLRDAMRAGASDDELAALIRAALLNKRRAHAGNAHAHPHPPSARARRPLVEYFLLARTMERFNLLFDRRYDAVDVSRYGESRSYGEPADDSDRRLGAVSALTGGRGRRAAAWARAPARARGYCSGSGSGSGSGVGAGAGLTHLDAQGRARMVDVGDKPETWRVAVAECRVRVPPRVRAALCAVGGAGVPKGDAVAAAELAGVLAAKRTAELIPLCHPLALHVVRVSVSAPPPHAGDALVRCEVRCRARTGAEMEALTGAAVAALTLYDMCKALDERREMRITDLRVVAKSGGKSDLPPPPPPPLRPLDRSPRDSEETYAPTNVAHF